jgi:hypothetical protein
MKVEIATQPDKIAVTIWLVGNIVRMPGNVKNPGR